MSKNNSERKYITEQEVLRKHHKFLRQSESQSQNSSHQEKERSSRKNAKSKNVYEKYGDDLARKYYTKLYKQFALIDLSRYETGQIGCRWRTQKQVVLQKGQKICGALDCSKKVLEIYEMNFGYMEQGIKKNALVKISVCKDCGTKLNHKKQHKRIKQQQPYEEKKVKIEKTNNQ